MINVSSQIEQLQAASVPLSAKLEELNSNVLSTGDDAIANLKEKLKIAIDTLNEDIRAMQADATSANENKKW
jgi:gas vesicle protein